MSVVDFIVFFFSAFTSIFLAPVVLLNYEPMEWWQWLFLLLTGLAASGGQFCVTAAYTYAPAKEISVYDYSQVIFAAILGFEITEGPAIQPPSQDITSTRFGVSGVEAIAPLWIFP